MAKYCVINNATAKLDGLINSSVTSMVLKEMSASMTSLLDYYIETNKTHTFLTITNITDTEHEIVEVTAWNTGTSTATIIRGRQAIAAKEWPDESIVELRVTASIAENPFQSWGGSGSMATPRANCYANGTRSIAFGSECIANGNYSTSLGIGCKSVGTVAFSQGIYGFANGQFSAVMGYGVKNNTQYSFAMGFDGDAYSPETATTDGINVHFFYGPNEGRGWFRKSVQIGERNAEMLEVIKTDVIDLTDDTEARVIDIPTGRRFFPDRIDVIITAVDTPGGSPTIRVGTDDSGNVDSILAASAVTVNAAHQRQSFTPEPHGVDNVRVSVGTAGSGTTYNCRVIVTGYLVW